MAKEKNNEVALVANSENFVQDALSAIKAKLNKLKHIQESVYKTTGKRVPGFNIEVQNETQVGQLIMMHSAVANRDKAYSESQAALGIDSAPTFKLEGYSKEDWENDIKLRIQVMQHKEELDKLKELEGEITQLMTNEDRKRIVAAKIAAL